MCGRASGSALAEGWFPSSFRNKWTATEGGGVALGFCASVGAAATPATTTHNRLPRVTDFGETPTMRRLPALSLSFWVWSASSTLRLSRQPIDVTGGGGYLVVPTRPPLAGDGFVPGPPRYSVSPSRDRP